ncbi:ankyrin repeat domain-containing protein 17-like [Cloeon dipterum]|uniref:ankyrin repeat domain-containing protein 17-like n=1 Tax=Cloeon dipterum TaxID=197152 RepID=UPI00321FEA48
MSTKLMEAASRGNVGMVFICLHLGYDVNEVSEDTLETALTVASFHGFANVVALLLSVGADTEVGALTPLMEAAQEGHIEVVRLLLSAGANVNATRSSGYTALTYAASFGHTDIVKLLLQHGADLDHESEGGMTPLMTACRAGHLDTVQFLMSKNADVNRRATNGHTPLSLARAHELIVKFLASRVDFRPVWFCRQQGY